MNRNNTGYIGAAILAVVGLALIAFAIAALWVNVAPETEPSHDTQVAEAAYDSARLQAMKDVKAAVVFTRISATLAATYGEETVRETMNDPMFLGNIAELLMGIRAFEALSPAESQQDDHDALMSTLALCVDGARTISASVEMGDEDLFLLGVESMMPCLDYLYNQETL